MPCNLPLVNRTVTINTKVPLTEKDVLLTALYDLSQSDRTFIYEEQKDGKIWIRTRQGEVTLTWNGERYTGEAKSQREADLVLEPVMSMYQATVLQNIFIEKGYLTGKDQDMNNTVQLTAWRS